MFYACLDTAIGNALPSVLKRMTLSYCDVIDVEQKLEAEEKEEEDERLEFLAGRYRTSLSEKHYYREWMNVKDLCVGMRVDAISTNRDGLCSPGVIQEIHDVRDESDHCEDCAADYGKYAWCPLRCAWIKFEDADEVEMVPLSPYCPNCGCDMPSRIRPFLSSWAEGDIEVSEMYMFPGIRYPRPYLDNYTILVNIDERYGYLRVFVHHLNNKQEDASPMWFLGQDDELICERLAAMTCDDNGRLYLLLMKEGSCERLVVVDLQPPSSIIVRAVYRVSCSSSVGKTSHYVLQINDANLVLHVQECSADTSETCLRAFVLPLLPAIVPRI